MDLNNAKYRKYVERLNKDPNNSIYAYKVKKYSSLAGGSCDRVKEVVTKIDNMLANAQHGGTLEEDEYHDAQELQNGQEHEQALRQRQEQAQVQAQVQAQRQIQEQVGQRPDIKQKTTTETFQELQNKLSEIINERLNNVSTTQKSKIQCDQELSVLKQQHNVVNQQLLEFTNGLQQFTQFINGLLKLATD